MSDFNEEVKGYCISTLDITNGRILYEGRDLRGYVLNTFPVLAALDSKGASLKYGKRINPMIPNQETDEYESYCELMTKAFEYLQLPEFLLAVGEEKEPLEIATNARLSTRCLTFDAFAPHEIEPEDLACLYYVKDYEEKAKNFLCPSQDTLEKAHLSSSEFIKKMQESGLISGEAARTYQYIKRNRNK